MRTPEPMSAPAAETTRTAPAPRRIRPTNVLALLALPLFAPALAPFVAEAHWTLDLLACFPVQALMGLCVAALGCAVTRRRWLAALHGAGALAAAAAVVPGFGGTPPTADEAAASLRLLCLNLQRGAEASAPAAIAAIRAHDPDVLFCSELTPGWLEALAPTLAVYDARCVHADPGYYGTGLFSRRPLRDATNVPLGVGWAPAVRAVVTLPAGELGLLCVHTPRPGNRARGRLRDLALAAIPAALADLPPARVVLGDFNATPWNPAFGAMLAAAELDRGSARTFRPTWPANLPWPLRIPIDHVLVGGGAALERCAAGAPFGSDHVPLSATVRVPAPH